MIFWRFFLEKIYRLFRKKGASAFDAVILIDMQPKYLARINKEKKKKMIQSQIKLLRYCAHKNIPVVVLECEDRGETINELWVEIKKIPRIEKITKREPNGFSEEGLSFILNKWKACVLLLTGINATACVIETALGGKNKGFQIITTSCLMADPETWTGTWYWFKKIGTHLESVDHLL